MTEIYLSKHGIANNYDNDSIVLVYDNWNDYGFVTTFKAYYFGSEVRENNNTFLGRIKIASSELSFDMQNQTYDILNKKYKTNDQIQIDFQSKEIYSIAPDYVFYRSISKLEQSEEILNKLNDITFLDSEGYETLQSDEDFSEVLNDSLLRTNYAKCVYKLSSIKNHYNAKNKKIHKAYMIF